MVTRTEVTHGPHAEVGMSNGNRYAYDANGNMTVRRELSGTETYVYTQNWTVDNRLASVIKASVTGTVFAVTTIAYDGDGARARKEDPDGTVLYPSAGSGQVVGATEAVIGAVGTATAEYFDDVSGTTLSSFYATRSVTVEAGLTRSFTDTPPLAGMGDAPLRLRSGQTCAVRWQLWLTVPVTDTYTFAVFADDGFSFNGNGLLFSNGTTRAATTTEATSGLVMTPGNVYNFALAYFNYTTATPAFAGAGCTIQLLWRRAGGALEIVPREAIHARGRRDYYSFAGAVVAMKEGVMSSATRTLTYLHGDHLGSTSLTTNASGQKVSEQRYKPYGEVRWSSGAGLPTDFTFTSQRAGPANYVGSLTDYVARFYSPALGRFVSADTIVPGAGNSQAYNRYMYVLGNPLRLVDPTGHSSAEECAQSTGSWCWENRWFEAHGYYWNGSGWDRNAGRGPAFGDIGILTQVLDEAGITWQSGDKDWKDIELYDVGKGVVALIDAILPLWGGPILKSLLGGGKTVFRRSGSSSQYLGAPASTNIADGIVTFFDKLWDYFRAGTYSAADVIATPVHELGHIVGHINRTPDSATWIERLPFGNPLGIVTSSVVEYAQGNPEYFCEALSVWAVADYRPDVGMLSPDQWNWLKGMTNGWGPIR